MSRSDALPPASARLRLREFVPADAAALVRMHREPRVRERLLDDYPLEQPAVAHLFIERLAALYRRHPGLGIWHAERRIVAAPADVAEARAAVAAGDVPAALLAWVLRERWAFCGWFNLMPMPDASGRTEIGCRLLPEAWGTGLALEGAQALLQHAFGPLALPEVWGVCDPAHRPVHAVLLSLGFVAAGVRDYGGQAAAMFRIDAAGARAAAATPLRERRRAAVRSVRAGTGAEPALACAARAVHAPLRHRRIHPPSVRSGVVGLRRGG